MVKDALAWMVRRAAEPSTHAGLAAAAQLANTFAPSWGPVFDAASALFVALAVALKEKAS